MLQGIILLLGFVGCLMLLGEIGPVGKYLLQLLCLSVIGLKLVLVLLWLMVVMDVGRIELIFL